MITGPNFKFVQKEDGHYYLQNVDDPAIEAKLTGKFYNISIEDQSPFRFVIEETSDLHNPHSLSKGVRRNTSAFSVILTEPDERTFGTKGFYEPYVGCFRFPQNGGTTIGCGRGLSFIGTVDIEDIGGGGDIKAIHYFWKLTPGGNSVKIGMNENYPGVVIVFSEVSEDNNTHDMFVRVYPRDFKEPNQSPPRDFDPYCTTCP